VERNANFYSYHVTRCGRVFNKFGRELKQQTNQKGYKMVGLSIGDGKKITRTIHRLVALVYIPNPYNLSDVDHIDGDRTNNHITNLRWLTHGENIRHSYNSGRRSAVGENNARAILTNSEVHDICCLFENGYRPYQVRDMGYPYVLVQRIYNKRSWKSISNHYSF